MSRGTVNKVILVGNLGRDPEMRYTQTGMAVANLALATTEVWKDKQTGENQERTEWHRVVMYQRLAEIANEYLKKGSKIYVEGKLQTRKWQDKNGQDRYTTEITADSLQMLDGKSSSGGENAFNASSSASKNQTSEPAQPASDPHAALESFDDDIPF